MSRNGYEDYYLHQAGTGLSVFAGNRTQAGHGLGNILGGLARMVIPIIRKGGKSILKEGIRTGVDVLGDISQGQDIKSSLKRRAKESGSRIVNKAVRTINESSIPGQLDRKPIKAKRIGRGRQSKPKQPRKHIATKSDIFVKNGL